jgi:hypothetical protein
MHSWFRAAIPATVELNPATAREDGDVTAPDDDAWSVRLLVDGFARVQESVRTAVDGLDPDALAWRPSGSGNSITWLVWHLTRVQDDHLADAAGTEQLWTRDGWSRRFRLPFDDAETGYGQASSDVDSVRVGSGDLLRDYHDAVHDQTVRQLRMWGEPALDQVVDEQWDPPVTLAVRLVSVLADDLAHAGQAEYVRGLLPAD